jgi:diaminopimelate epimerase
MPRAQKASQTIPFFKGHGLGNDYVVLEQDPRLRLTPARIRAICDRNRGIGSDGILLLCPSKRADFGLRIFNPDGSEAEKSGNGLRIFARFLHATGRTRKRRFSVETPGGMVAIELHVDAKGDASEVTVQMGNATFDPKSLPCTIAGPELVDREIKAAGQTLRFNGVSVGNPHCVVFRPKGKAWTREELLKLGPALENHPAFPRRVNVQLAVPIGPRKVRILVWERGAGETAASGSSACAVAAAAIRRGLVKSPVQVEAPGGSLTIEVGPDFALTMRGPVQEVARGTLSPSFLRELGV